MKIWSESFKDSAAISCLYLLNPVLAHSLQAS